MINIITIDGPASSGKGTVAKLVAQKLNFNYLDSGAIYRVVALFASRNNLDATNPNEILKLIDSIDLKFIQNRIIINNNEDVTDLVRNENIGMRASSIASISQIRTRLLDFQRSFAKEPGLITDGRDMGSIVFPNAILKVFLTASAEVRAKRRADQLQAAGMFADYNAILEDIVRRDEQDLNRKAAPLKFDNSFEVVDNSSMNIDKTVTTILDLYATFAM